LVYRSLHPVGVAVTEWRANAYGASGHSHTANARNFEQNCYTDLGGQPRFEMAIRTCRPRGFLILEIFA
jgi:hypothetical protein